MTLVPYNKVLVIVNQKHLLSVEYPEFGSMVKRAQISNNQVFYLFHLA